MLIGHHFVVLYMHTQANGTRIQENSIIIFCLLWHYRGDITICITLNRKKIINDFNAYMLRCGHSALFYRPWPTIYDVAKHVSLHYMRHSLLEYSVV